MGILYPIYTSKNGAYAYSYNLIIGQEQSMSVIGKQGFILYDEAWFNSLLTIIHALWSISILLHCVLRVHCF